MASNAAVFGGDEVGAIVLDVGSCNTKVGFAGEDTPKGVFPTSIGCTEVDEDAGAMDTGADGAAAARRKGIKYSVGTSNLCVPRADMEIKCPLEDGLVTDWDQYEQLLHFTYQRALFVDPADHPVMVSEVAWNTRKHRDKLAELLFEKFNVPAIYLCKDAVLTAFSSGRSSGLVVNAGASGTSAVAVYDGYVINAATQRSRLGGDFLTRKFQNYFAKDKKLDIVPHYMIKSKTPVEEGEPAKYVPRQHPFQVRPSYHNYMVKSIIQDFQMQVARVASPIYDEPVLAQLPTTPFEFPNGYNDMFGLERFRYPELLFAPNFMGPGDDMDTAPDGRGAPLPSERDPVQTLVSRSIDACDTDIQHNLWSNVILSGGCTLTHSYVERLQIELNLTAVGTKFKVIASPSSQERLFSSWVGGSILASLGSFQQMWVSRAEFAENRDVIEKKCQ